MATKNTKKGTVVRLESYELSCLLNHHGCYVIARETVRSATLGSQTYYTVRLDKVQDLYTCGLPVGAVEARLAESYIG